MASTERHDAQESSIQSNNEEVVGSRKSSGSVADPLIEDDPSAQVAANAEVESLIDQVKASLGEATDENEAAEEALDEVKVADHFEMAGLTLEDKNEASVNPNSASNSVSASPAIGASQSDTTAASRAALSALPSVELKDGGNASSLGDATSSTSSVTAKENFYDVRVAIVGNVDSGKSTLIGVLTGGQLDDGRGKARSRVFIHAHELGTGRTSAISQHIMGFDAEGKPVHQTVAASAQSAAKSKSWSQVVAASRSVMTFIDLAGHEKYLKTTIAGLTGSHPDYACVIVNSLAGVTKMTKEHLGVVLALEIPLICVVTKVDLVPSTVLESSKKQLFRILKSSAANKIPIQMRNEKDIETVLTNSESSNKICPVFFISAVNGTHINLLTSYLSKLKPHLEWLQSYANNMGLTKNPDGTVTSHPNACEFSIDEVFNVSGVGIVVSGTLQSGTLHANSTLLLGPQSDNSFIQVLVRSLHYKRVSCASVEAGQSCAVSIRAVKRKETLKRNLIRRGMVLVDPIVNPKSTRIFDAEVLILHHPTTIKLGYQAVLHAGMIRQTAQICRIQKQCLRTGDKSICRFRFLLREEYIHTGTSFVFREGSTKGIGKITRIEFTPEEIEELEEEERGRKKGGGQQQKQQQKKADGSEEGASTAETEQKGEEASATESSTSASILLAAPTPTKQDKPQHHHKQKEHHKADATDETSASSSSTSATAGAYSKEARQKWSHKEKHEYQKQREVTK